MNIIGDLRELDGHLAQQTPALTVSPVSGHIIYGGIVTVYAVAVIPDPFGDDRMRRFQLFHGATPVGTAVQTRGGAAAFAAYISQNFNMLRGPGQ